MTNTPSLRRLAVAVALVVAFLFQGTWALAGTTGSLSGTVSDESGAPLAGAHVTASSPSQTASATTDAKGHFVFLSLAPDTYSVSVLKDGYEPSSLPGVTVFADNMQTLAITEAHHLKNIAKVVSRRVGSLVKSGTVADVYSVNAATAQQVQSIGGGNNLDSAYSAIYSQPGVNSQLGVFGFGQVFYIHGSAYNQIGYEFDGVPVNRSFDNYNASSLSNLGNSETQVYTGASPSDSTSPTVGGYINQVIRTGTYPGFANLTGALGFPGFYHKAEIEAGGSNPNRTFSYYVAVRGANSNINQLDRYNGGRLNPDGSNAYGQSGAALNVWALLNPFQANNNGPWTTCNADGTAPAGSSTTDAAIGGLFGSNVPLAECQNYAPLYGGLATALRGTSLQDRETLANFHFAIPHRHDAGRDDVQLLFSNFLYHTDGYDNISTNGGFGLLNAAFNGFGGPNGYALNYVQNLYGDSNGPVSATGAAGSSEGLCQFLYFEARYAGNGVGCAQSGPGPLPYLDGSVLQGVAFGQRASTVSSANLVPYYFPSSSTARPMYYGVSPYATSGINNNGSIVKLQYQKNIGSNAYLRVYGYSFYSDWLQSSANAALPFAIFNIGASGTQPDYELATHTRGGQIEYANQINSKNLISAAVSYVTAGVVRTNNSQAGRSPNGSPVASLIGPNGTCYSKQINIGADGRPIDPSYYVKGQPALPAGSPVSCLSALANNVLYNVTHGRLQTPAGQAAAAGAQWEMTSNLAIAANRNTVTPRFATVSLQDEFRPSEKLDLNIGARLERYSYVLGDGGAGAEASFWTNQINQTACVDPNGNKQIGSVVFFPSGISSSANPYLKYYTTLPGQACGANPLNGNQLYHPGTNGIPLVSIGGGGTLTHTTLSPRFGGTYTFNPDTVLRFSYGRYTQPVNTAAEQSLTYEDGYTSATSVYASGFYNTGLGTQVHDNQIQYANNFDISYERHIKGTDVSFKVSPFYSYVSQQSVQVSLPGGLAGTFNGASKRVKGVELQIQKGDPNRNGLSGQLSYTYTDARIKYSLINGTNIVAQLNGLPSQFLSLEGANGGAPCYSQAAANPVGTKDAKGNWIILPNPTGLVNCDGSAFTSKGGTPYALTAGAPAATFIANPYYSMNVSSDTYALDGWYRPYANTFPNGPGGGGNFDTALSPNVFAGFLTYKHDKWRVALNGIVQGGQRYGAPGDNQGIDPRGCLQNQGSAGVGLSASSQLADYQTCGTQIVVPDPATGKFDGLASFVEPWQLNIGGAVSYEMTPRVSLTMNVANLVNRCFGGTKEPWTQDYKPNSVTCAYAPNGSYLNWSPNEVYNTAGAGWFYGNTPHDKANGTAGYPHVLDESYAPVENGLPLQVYFQVNIKL